MANATRARESRVAPPKGRKEGKSGGSKAGGAEPQDGGRIFLDIRNDHKPRHRTHNNRIPENGGHGNEALPPGIPGFRGSGGDGGSPYTSFIGEKASGNAETRCALQRASDETAGGRFCLKSAAKYQGKAGKNKVTVQEQKVQAAANIEKAKGRNHSRAEFADGFHAAEDDEPGGKGCENTDDMGRYRRYGIHCLGDGRGLGGAAHPEGGKQCTGGIKDSQRFAVQPLFQYIHRAAHICLIRFLLFEQNA